MIIASPATGNRPASTSGGGAPMGVLVSGNTGGHRGPPLRDGAPVIHKASSREDQEVWAQPGGRSLWQVNPLYRRTGKGKERAMDHITCSMMSLTPR